MSDRLWRLLARVRGHERQRFVFFGSLSLLVSAAQTLGLVGSEALFLARYGAGLLPITFIAASLLTVAGSFAYALAVGRARNDELFIRMLAGTALVLSLASVAAALGVGPVIPVLFCLYFLFQAVSMNHFVTFAVDYFDASASKRMFPLFTIGASLGAAAGGAIGVLIARAAGPVYLIVGWAAVYTACAIQLRLARRRLRRWGPLDLEEADETSVESMRGAARYLRGSPLGRALVLSALGMVVALFIAQYLYSDIFVRAFPDPADLATFFGVYQCVTNVIEIGVGFTITPWLIRHGVASANLLHPLLTLVSFGALGIHQGLASGIAARVNKELVDNSLGFPIRSLVYNAMPVRLRGRMRAFLEGVVVYAGMSGAGVLLLAMGHPDPIWLCAAGALAAVLFLAANLLARREYLRALVGQLRAGSIDFADIGDEIGEREAVQLAELWEQMLREDRGRPSRSLLEIIPNLARLGVVDPLIRETAHPSPVVRRSCLVALADVQGEEVDRALQRALDDPDAEVRLAALHAAVRRGRASSELDATVRALVDDPAPEVRARAACHAGARGLEVLRRMLASKDPAIATAALAVAPPTLLDAVYARARDPDPTIRAAALQSAADPSREPPLSEAELLAATRDPDARVRRAAVMVLANLDSDAALAAVAAALADPAVDVARTAQTLLGSLGGDGMQAVEPHLESEVESAVTAALRVLHAAGARERLYAQLRERARQLWYYVIAYQRLPAGAAVGGRFLRAAYEDAMMRCRRIAFRILELIEDPSVIRKVERSMRHPSSRTRGDALEVLSNLGDREAAGLLVLMHEEGSLAEKIRAVERLVPVPRSAAELIDASLRSDLRFVRMGARACECAEGEPPPEEETMERLLALKQVPLFAQLSLEQLEAVLRIATEQEYTANEVIIREGDPGDQLYLLIEGKVNIYKNYGSLTEELTNTQGVGSYFGEMAILDGQPRSVTVVAARSCRLLCLHGSSLMELVQQMPQISFEIFRVLTQRVRRAEERLTQRSG